MVDYVLDIAKTYGAPIALSVRDDEQLADFDLPQLVDHTPGLGPISALLSAFKFASQQNYEYVLLLSNDQPFLPGNLATRLLSAIAENGVATPLSRGREQNMASLWRVNQPSLENYIRDGGRSLWRFANQVGRIGVVWDTSSADPFADIDDRSQLKEAEDRLKKAER